LGLEALNFTLVVIALVDEVGLPLLPLCSVTFVRQQQLSLLALNAGWLELKLAFARVEVFAVFFKLALILA